ncbi:Usher syndrome type-1c protein-binding protein 1 [Lasiodiplodia theobromae]|uniref:Usher syndrome type-1c protein-binding protein 1 n=1 Tax=Lasiodiplodia theobromae TaxID=45133 RepID=UPI0015C3B38F|nr:Usher syndrome type-1c protein-binding protein 1 [Lasiodiplodia theobromae]KAF4535730.1 Usher syndrome type-1c protein-binding protein 1 [Lasiodiplodia theobromae]
MFRFFSNAPREEPQPQDEEPATDAVAPAQQAYPEPPRSPRLQVEHSRRLEEELAILRADLADQRAAYEAKLSDQRAKLTAKLASQRDKYESKTARLAERNEWLEGTVAKRAEEKQWLERRNDALEATEKKLDARIGTLEERVFELQAENWALKQENADLRADYDGVVGDLTTFRKGTERLLEGMNKALAKPRAKDVRGSPKTVEGGRKGGEEEEEEEEDEDEEEGAQETPRGKRIEAPDASLSGETLRTRSRDGNGGEGRSRHPQAGGSVDPRSLDALRTLGPSSRNVSPTRGRQRRLGGSGAVTAGTASSDFAGTENVAIRPSKKRQRTSSDTEL